MLRPARSYSFTRIVGLLITDLQLTQIQVLGSAQHKSKSCSWRNCCGPPMSAIWPNRLFIGPTVKGRSGSDCGPNDLLWLCGQTLPLPLFPPDTESLSLRAPVACWRFISMSLGPPGAGSRRGCSGGAKAIARQEKRRSPSAVPSSNLAGERLLSVEGADRTLADQEPPGEMSDRGDIPPRTPTRHNSCAIFTHAMLGIFRPMRKLALAR
jgi:hypothetical protein